MSSTTSNVPPAPAEVPADAPSNRAAGLYENLHALSIELAPLLNPDQLAKLNACVTEAQSLAGVTGPTSPSHAPMEAPHPTVQNPATSMQEPAAEHEAGA